MSTAGAAVMSTAGAAVMSTAGAEGRAVRILSAP